MSASESVLLIVIVAPMDRSGSRLNAALLCEFAANLSQTPDWQMSEREYSMLEPGATKRVARLGQAGVEGSLAGENVTAPTLARSGQQVSNGEVAKCR